MYLPLKKACGFLCIFLFFNTVTLFAQSAAGGSGQSSTADDVLWRQALGGAVLSLPDVQAQSAVVALDGGNIRAYSAAGTLLWDYSPMGKITPYVTRSREGTSYLSRNNGTLIAVNRSGRELWRRSPGGPLCGKVIPGWDGRLFVPTEKKISCYTASGNLLWTRTFEADFRIAPQLDRGGGIMLALENNEVFRSSPFGDIQKWTLSNRPVVLLSIGQKDTAQILALYGDGSSQILGQGEERRIQAERFPKLPSGPIAAVGRGNEIAVVFNDGSVTLVSLDEGKTLWTADSHIRECIKNGVRIEPEAEMIFDERGIYVLSKDGASGFTRDGRRLWYTILKNTAAVPAFGDDGVLYSGGKDWILYAYKLEDRILPQRRLLYGPVPEGSYRTGSPLPSYISGFPLNEYEIEEKLEQISAALNTGNVGTNEPFFTSWLMTIADGQFPIRQRIGALRLLGQIGSQETIPWLANFFRKEPEVSVKAAAASAIGAIGVDHNGDAIGTFLYIATRSDALYDEQVLAAIAQAAGALCRFSGPPLSRTGIRILTALSSGTYSPLVKRQARRELVLLRNG